MTTKESAGGVTRCWICVHFGDAESPEVPDASFETPKECGKSVFHDHPEPTLMH